MRISDWSSDVCSSDLGPLGLRVVGQGGVLVARARVDRRGDAGADDCDRKRVVSGKSVSVRVDLGGRRLIKKNTITNLVINCTYSPHSHTTPTTTTRLTPHLKVYYVVILTQSPH